MRKIIDRVANMKRSMIGFFDKEKLTRYCDETENIIIPRLEGFIAVIEKPEKGNEYYRLYSQYAEPLRLLRGFLKGFSQAGREHLELMEKNEALKSENQKLLKRIKDLESELQKKEARRIVKD